MNGDNRTVAGVVGGAFALAMGAFLVSEVKNVTPAQAQAAGATAAQKGAPASPMPSLLAPAPPADSAAVDRTVKAFQAQVAPPPPPEKVPAIEFASAVQPGDHPGPGDVVRTIRPFAHWTLVCDALTGKRQICFLEQQVKAADGVALTWQVAQTADGHVMTILKMPPDVSDAGLKLSFGGFDRVERSMRCDASACLVILPFEGRIADWITSESSVAFGFDRGGKPYSFTASLEGFQQAVAAIPRGKAPEPAPAEAATRTPQPYGATARHERRCTDPRTTLSAWCRSRQMASRRTSEGPQQ
ncbi:Invasion protein IalB, involved in pathogenesis [Rhizobiales bacterium GAS113]|nr:Invasion protein IalB, involved in pathogenesis [Rhizobiales bacterium GAS113]